MDHTLWGLMKKIPDTGSDDLEGIFLVIILWDHGGLVKAAYSPKTGSVVIIVTPLASGKVVVCVLFLLKSNERGKQKWKRSA